MPQVLAESFGISHTVLLTLLSAPAFHRFHILIHAMMLPKPLTLTGMGGQHGRLDVHDVADVDGKRWWNGLAEEVLSFNRITVVQMWNAFERRGMAAVVKTLLSPLPY